MEIVNRVSTFQNFAEQKTCRKTENKQMKIASQ